MFLPRPGRGHRIPPHEINFRANIDALKRAGATSVLSISAVGSPRAELPPGTFVLAESKLPQSFGCDVIGMTHMPEAKLAREAELCYSSVAMVTDFDCWHPDHDHVQVKDVLQVMHANGAHARQLLQHVIPRIGADAGPCAHGCDRALEHAVLTAPEAHDPELVHRLDAVAGRVLRKRASS